MQKFLNGKRSYIEELGLDEASQLSAGDLLPILYRLIPMGWKRMVTFGDWAQLNPFGTSGDRQIASVIDLLYKHQEGGSHVLNIQYRLPELIASLISKVFYGERLLWHPSKTYDGRDGFMWVHVDGLVCRQDSSPYNEDEALAAERHLTVIRQLETVKTPTTVLNFFLEDPAKCSHRVRRRNRCHRPLSGQREGPDCPQPRCHVRKFLGDPRRLNVAVTRASKSLNIVGNVHFWKTQDKQAPALAALAEAAIAHDTIIRYSIK